LKTSGGPDAGFIKALVRRFFVSGGLAEIPFK